MGDAGLWVVHGIMASAQYENWHALFVNASKDSLQHWNERLAHATFQDLLKMVSNIIVDGMGLANKKITLLMACAKRKRKLKQAAFKRHVRISP